MCLEIYKHPLLINVYPTAATCVPWYVCGNHVAGSAVNAVGIRSLACKLWEIPLLSLPSHHGGDVL